MAYAQTTYTDSPAAGYAGLVANGETSNRISRTVKDVAAIAFGKAVFRPAGGVDDDHNCTLTPAAGQLLGITIANGAGQADTYGQYATAAILTQGVIWVQTSEAVADGDQAYVTSAGVINKTSASNTILTGWFFQDTITSGAGGLTRLAKR